MPRELAHKCATVQEREKMILICYPLDFLDAGAAVQQRLPETFGLGDHFEHRFAHTRGEFGVRNAEQLGARDDNWFCRRCRPARTTAGRFGCVVDPLERHSVLIRYTRSD
jgi:hypothetical protein